MKNLSNKCVPMNECFNSINNMLTETQDVRHKKLTSWISYLPRKQKLFAALLKIVSNILPLF